LKKMKRSSEDSNNNPYELKAKRLRGDKVEARILIPSKVAGGIIGKSGSNIQKLRLEFDSKILIPDSPGPERVMTIMSINYETVVKILKQILPLMQTDLAKSKNEAETRLLIHKSFIGAIIGREGHKIKFIRLCSGASIRVYPCCAPQSTERCVAIQGTPEAIEKATMQIYMVISDTEMKGAVQLFNPAYFDEYYAHEYGGFGPSRVQGHRWPNETSYDLQRTPLVLNRRILGLSHERNRSSLHSASSLITLGGIDPAYDCQQSSVQVTVPKGMAGAIIGPGGARIRQIRNESHASITIDGSTSESPDRIITISGSPHQIHLAQYLLQQSIRENHILPISVDC
jgi:heterogeneous nuclear ribonucleoprotein K